MPRFLTDRMFVIIDNRHYDRYFAWLPKLCETGEWSIAEWKWFQWYWKCDDILLSNFSNKWMNKAIEKRNIASQASAYSSAYPSTALSIAIQPTTPIHLDPKLEQVIKDLIEKYVNELEKKFMDELFAQLPASTIPQTQIDKIYEQMGYEK